MKAYWAKLLGTTERIKLYEKPGVEYNMINLENFVYRQAGNAISAMIEIVGEDRFHEELDHRGVQQNLKYQALINQYGRKKQDGRDEGEPEVDPVDR